MNTSNYDSKTKDSSYSNDTTFSQKRFGELVTKVNELQTANFGSNVSVEQILSSGTKIATVTVDDQATDLYCTSGGGSVGTGLVNDNGMIRLAMLRATSYNNGQIIINIDSQHDTPYTYDDDYDGEGTEYEDNQTPYVIDLSQNEYKFNSVSLSISKFMMTQVQVDDLKPSLKSVFAKVYWKSGAVSTFTHVPPSSAWSSNGFHFDFTIPPRSTYYPSEGIFDTIERIELVMTNSTNTSYPYGYNIGTFFPAGSSILVNGTYFA